MSSRWTLQQFRFTTQCHGTLNINSSKSYFSLSDLFSACVCHNGGSSESQSEQGSSLLTLQDLECPQAWHLVNLYTSSCAISLLTYPVMWKETRKRKFSLHGTTLYPSYLIHPLHPFIFGHIRILPSSFSSNQPDIGRGVWCLND